MRAMIVPVVASLVALSGWVVNITQPTAPASGQQTRRIVGGFTHMRVYDAAGTFTVPQGVGRLMVEIRGAGGGGGSGNASNAVGQGGSGGGYGKGIFNVSAGSMHVVDVGAGGLGAAGTCSVGLSGESSSFGSLITATGGGGGGGCGTSSTPGTSTAPLNFAGHGGQQYFQGGTAPENPGGACGDGSTVGVGGNGNAFFGRDGADGNVVVFW